MKNRLLKTLFVSFIMLFSAFFINIDGVKAAIPFCSVNDEFSESASCEYSVKGLFTNQQNIQLYFGVTTAGKYCTEIKNIEYISWFDVNNSDEATTNGKVEFDLTDDTMRQVIVDKSCPKLKFVNEYDKATTETTKFTVSDQDMDLVNGAGCVGSQLISFGSECVIINGENFKQISSVEMENTISDSSVDRLKEDANDTYIKNWARQGAGTLNKELDGYCGLIGDELIDWLNSFLMIINVIAIILLVVMTAVEFIKAITGSDEDGLKGAIKHTFIRLIVIVVLLLLPVLVTWILNVVNDSRYQVDENGNIVIGADGNPLCDITGGE